LPKAEAKEKGTTNGFKEWHGNEDVGRISSRARFFTKDAGYYATMHIWLP